MPGGSKQSGLPDPEMSAHSDDVSSDGLPQKKGRRCGRYRCPIITVCAVIAVVAVACAVYFSGEPNMRLQRNKYYGTSETEREKERESERERRRGRKRKRGTERKREIRRERERERERH